MLCVAGPKIRTLGCQGAVGREDAGHERCTALRPALEHKRISTEKESKGQSSARFDGYNQNPDRTPACGALKGLQH